MKLYAASAFLAALTSCDGAFHAPPAVSYGKSGRIVFQKHPQTVLYAIDPNKERLSVDDITAEADEALKSAQKSLENVNGQQGGPTPPTKPPAPLASPTDDNPALKFMQSFASKVGKFVADAAVGAASKVAEEVKAVPGKIVDAASSAAKKQADNLVASIQAIPVNIQNAAQRKAEETVNDIKAIPRKVQEAATKKADETIKEIEAIPGKIADAALDAADKLAEEAAATPGRIADSAQKAVTKAIDDVTALPRKQLEKLEALLEGDKPQVPQPPRVPPPPPATSMAKVEAPRKPEPPKTPPRVPQGKSLKVEAPKLELPKIEAPKIDLPALELPKIEPPKIDLPKIEPPAFDTPKTAPAAKPAAKKPDDSFIFSEVSLKTLLSKDAAATEEKKEIPKQRKREDEARLAARKRQQQEAAAKAREAEAKRKADMLRKREEEQARKEAIEAKRRAELDAKRQAEMTKQQQLAQAEKARMDAQRRAEQERKLQELKARQEAEEKKRQEAAAKRQAEIERKKREAEEQRAAVEKARLEREAANKAALAKKQEEARKAAAARVEQQRIEAERRKEAQRAAKPSSVPFSSPSLRVAPSPKKPAQRYTKAPAGTSTIVRWRLRRDGGISGLVYGNANFDDGDRIETTKIVTGDIENGCVVETGSGSRYFLSDTPPGGADSKVNRANAMKDLFSALPGATITLTRQTRDKDAKTALETVEQAKPRSTFSLFGSTAKIESSVPVSKAPTVKSKSVPVVEKRPMKTAPRGVPSISKWKENRDGSITGLISGSPNFRDGERVTTSPIVSGRIASEETVRTGSGSRYFLV